MEKTLAFVVYEKDTAVATWGDLIADPLLVTQTGKTA
jgi:hypothetical protein